MLYHHLILQFYHFFIITFNPNTDRLPPPRTHTHTHTLPLSLLPPLRQRIPPINHDIAPRLVTTRIARQIKINPLDLVDVALAAQHSHAVCLVDDSLRGAHRRGEETRRHDVDAGEGAVFAGERTREVRGVGFGGVVDLGGGITVSTTNERN